MVRTSCRVFGFFRKVRATRAPPFTRCGTAFITALPSFGKTFAASGTSAPMNASASDSLSADAAAWPRCSIRASGYTRRIGFSPASNSPSASSSNSPSDSHSDSPSQAESVKLPMAARAALLAIRLSAFVWGLRRARRARRP